MILIISRDLQFRTLVGAELFEKGYEAEGVETISDALRVWARAGDPPKLILFDAAGQDLSASSLALLVELARKSILVVCAGNLEASQVDFARYGARRTIIRPASVGEVVSAVIELLKSADS